MNRRFKKLIAVVCAIAMVVTSVTVYNSTAKAEAADYSTLTYTVVEGTEYAVAPLEDFPISWARMDGDAIMFELGVASGTNPIWPAFSDMTLNGVAVDAAHTAGAWMKVWPSELKENAYNVVEATSAVTNEKFHVIVKNGTPSEEPDETTTVDPDAPTTTPAPTTTAEVKVPATPTGLVVNINDLKTNYTIAFAPVSGAKTFKLYVDGEYKKDITNGGVVTIEELGLEAGKTYTFGVTAVNEAGESDKATVQVTVPAGEDTTTGEASSETTTPADEFDPTTITDWKTVTNSKTISYYIADGADNKVTVKPQVEGDNIYTAFALAAKFKSVTLDGVAQEVSEGAFHRVKLADLTEGYHTLVVENFYGNEKVTIYFKAEKEAETTTAAYVDGAVLVDDAAVKEVPKYEGGDPWQAEFNNAPVNYVQGKKYVAEVVVSSDVAKKIKLVFQNADNWSFIDADGGYEVDIAAGNKVKITYVFEAAQSTSNGNFDIYLGSVAEAATLNFESKKLTTYTEDPAGVTTGVEILATPVVPETKVTVDGTEVAVEDGKVTLGDAEYGYLCDGKMYAPNTTVDVVDGMAFTSVNELSVTMANGAGIRYAGTAGIRFQASIASDNMDAVASEAITEGTLITAQDIYDAFEEELTLTYSHAKIDVKNSGWFNGQTGTYCGSICDVVESNYIRNFTARAYVTVNYENADAVTIYSNMGPARSISQVATAVKNAGYPGIPTESQSIIDSFIK